MDAVRAADRYREAYSGFRWRVPADFNITAWACRRWVGSARVALQWEDEGGAQATVTYDALLEAANRLSNALRHLGIGRGERVAIMLPQRPETAVAYLACFQSAAIAVP